MDRCVGEWMCPSLFFFTTTVYARGQARAPAGLALRKDPIVYFGAFS